MEFEQILTQVDGGVMTITLNRPDRLNAWTATMGRELIAAIDLADGDDEVRAVIVTGAGRGFCAGADLAAGGDTFDWRKRGGEGPPRDNGGPVHAPRVRVHEAGHRGDQWPRGRDRGDDDAADGHPPGRR